MDGVVRWRQFRLLRSWVLFGFFVAVFAVPHDVTAQETSAKQLSKSTIETLHSLGAANWEVDRDGNLTRIWLKDARDETIQAVVAQFPKLQSVHLEAGNQPDKRFSAKGLKQLEKLNELTEIRLSLTEPTVESTAALSQLQRITKLGLAIDRLSPTDLTHLAKLTAVKRLDLNARSIDDATTAALLACFPNLTGLNLNGKAASSLTMSEIERHREMQSLELGQTFELTADDLAHVAQLTKLERLVLQGGIRKQTYDSLLEQVGKITTLRELEVSIGHTDAGMEHLAMLTKLEQYHDHSEQITDKSLHIFAGMPNLRRLELHSPIITGEGLSQLKHRDQLKWLRLNHTGLQPEHVRSLADLPALELLDVSWTPVEKDDGYRTLFALKNLKSLTHLHVVIPDAEAKNLRAELPNCEIDTIE